MRMQSDPRNNHPSCLHIHWSQPPACSERQLSSLQHAFIHCHSSPVMFHRYPTRSNIHVRQDASGTLRISVRVCNTPHHITAHNYTKPIAVAPLGGEEEEEGEKGEKAQEDGGTKGETNDDSGSIRAISLLRPSYITPNQAVNPIPTSRLGSVLVVSYASAANVKCHRSHVCRRSDVFCF